MTWQEFLTVVPILGAIYCLGGLHGLYLAWSQPARMRRYAERVDVLQERHGNPFLDRWEGVK